MADSATVTTVLDPGHLRRLAADAAAFLGPSPRHPCYAGAVVLAGTADGVAVHDAVGHALRYARYDERTGTGTELPRERWIPMRPGTVFDLASLTKVFTSVVALRQMERGTLGADDRVASHLPGFEDGGKGAVTVRHLLTHASGLRPELAFHGLRTPGERRRLLFREVPLRPPGTARIYSDLNFVALQWVLERVTGRGLDALVRDDVTGPLGMRSTRFAPPASWRGRIAATEDQRRPWGRLDRGLVHGEVHDENAYAFGGVAGHAGLFSDGPDLAVLCRALLGGGSVGGRRVLAPGSVDLLFGGLGLDRDRPAYQGELAGPGTAGHTGFTGTCLVLSPGTGTFLVLLTNAVHPHRGWSCRNAPRAALATRLAGAALAGRGTAGPEAGRGPGHRCALSEPPRP